MSTYVPSYECLTALAALMSPLPPPGWSLVTPPELPRMVVFATFGDIERASYINAATPEMIAAAWDVPVPFM